MVEGRFCIILDKSIQQVFIKYYFAMYYLNKMNNHMWEEKSYVISTWKEFSYKKKTYL